MSNMKMCDRCRKIDRSFDDGGVVVASTSHGQDTRYEFCFHCWHSWRAFVANKDSVPPGEKER